MQLDVNSDGTPDRWLRPVDLGRVVGLSASQIRNYEKAGFLPSAQRSPTGHRRYSQAHLDALHVARRLIDGYGWQRALQIMRAVHAGDEPAALVAVDACHADLHHQRAQLEQVLHTIKTISPDEPPRPAITKRTPVRIAAAAATIGARPSALRFWEQQGLLHPIRDRNGARFYDHQQLQRLQVIKLLREAGHRFIAIRSVLHDLDDNQPSQVRTALEERRQSIEHASRRAMHATSALHNYLQNQKPTASATTAGRPQTEPVNVWLN